MAYCKDAGHKCIHRKYLMPSLTFCSYLLDTNELRGCDTKKCTHWKDTEIKIDSSKLALHPIKKDPKKNGVFK